MKPLAALFSLVVAAAGWFYALYSRPPEVRGEEAGRLSRKRQRLRRTGGVVMMALAICFFAGFWTVDWEPPTKAFYWIWVAVAGLLAAIVALAIADLGLTWKLHKVLRKGGGFPLD